MLEVEGGAVLAGFGHTPLVVRGGAEKEAFGGNAVAVDNAAVGFGTDERHVPAALLQVGLEIADGKWAFVLVDVCALARQLGLHVHVPAVGSGVAHYEHGFAFNRVLDRFGQTGEVGAAHGPVAQVEGEAVGAAFGHAPFLVGIAGVHLEWGAVDGGFAYLLAVGGRTDEGSVPAARGEAQLELAGIEGAFPGEHEGIFLACLERRGSVNAPAVGRGVAHHVERGGLDGQVAFDDDEVLVVVARCRACGNDAGAHGIYQRFEFHLAYLL